MDARQWHGDPEWLCRGNGDTGRTDHNFNAHQPPSAHWSVLRVEFVADRREAIGRALAAARPGDCVVVTGKGHESTQEFADTVVPFDDRQVVRELLDLRRGNAS